jgi:hypothetical protein
MVKLIVHDSRLSGRTPTSQATAALLVNETHRITQVLNWIKGKASRYGTIEDLYIMAHGYENDDGVGGYGVALTGDGILQSNVQLWSGLYGKVNHIYLMACGAAAVGPRIDGEGDGRYLCSSLAIYARSWVVASTSPQRYSRGIPLFGLDQINFGDWEGTVYSFDPCGDIKYIEQNDN